MARSRLCMRSALGVFLCMQYNRNSRFNFVGKGSTGRRWDSQADRSDRSVGTFHNRLQSQLSEFSRRLRGKVEVGNRSILKELPSPPCLAVVSPRIREKRSWGATPIDEPAPMVDDPGNRFQSEPELMAFSHKSGRSLRKARTLEQSGADGWESHIGSHGCILLLLTCNRCYSLISLL